MAQDLDRPPSRRRSPLLYAGLALVAAALVAGVVVAWPRNDDPAESSDNPEVATTTPPTPEPVAADPTCEEGSLDGRTYILCTAGDQDDQGLVVALHGRGSAAAEMQAGTQLEWTAAHQGLAVVYPDGIDNGWGDDTFATPSRPAGDEDVVFLDQLVTVLRADPRIDDRPVGLVGFSNGASMALRYAAQRPAEVRAVVAVAGQLPRDSAVRPAEPVPTMVVYGSTDPVRGYETGIPDPADSGGVRQPGQPTPTLPTRETVAAFVSAAGGPAEPDETTETDPDPADGTTLRTESWTGTDDAPVVLHTVVGGGHTWPSSHTAPASGASFGVTSRDLDASVAAIEFVLAHGRT
jgi:polyhydroxybutyrate depolymerase